MSSRSTIRNPLTYPVFQKEAADMVITVKNPDGTAVDCSAANGIELWGKPLSFANTDYQFEKTFADFAVTGDDGNILTVNLNETDRDFTGILYCILKIKWSTTKRLKANFKLDATATPE